MKISVAGIEFSYGSRSAISDIGFEASEGDIVSILGPNGVGKTTLLKCINSIHRPSGGEVYVDSEDVLAMQRPRIAQVIGYVPQRSHTSGTTVFESVLIGRKPHIHGTVSDRDIDLVGRIISIMGLSSISDKAVNEISGGEYQMVQIARALAQQPKVILLDEPTSNLDLRNQYTVMHTVFHIIRENGMCAVMTNHDLNLSLRFSNRFVLMKGGQIFAAGGSEVITEENIREVYGIDVTVGEVNGYKVVVPNELDHRLSPKVDEFLGKRKRNPKQKEFFDEKADSWDESSMHDHDKIGYITDLLDIEEDSRVLDVGTGTGVMIPFYLKKIKTGRVTAVDYSEKMIETAMRKNPESHLLRYRVLDICDLDEKERYDRVVCYSCFPHFHDPMKAISRMVGALKHGGLFAIAHSSSKEHINNVHSTGGEEICNDYLPDIDVMEEIYRESGLEVVFSRDDSEYYIAVGRKA